MKRTLSLSTLCVIAALSVMLAQCSGSGGNASSTPPTSRPTTSPTAAPTGTPTARPTPTPTPRPTPTPTPRPTPTPVPTPTPTPTAVPTPTPTPTTGPTITFNPNPVIISGIGTGCSTSASFTASEPGYTGNFTGKVANTAIATLAQSTTSGTFTVNSATTNNGPPNTSVTVKDSHGNSATETVDVSICL